LVTFEVYAIEPEEDREAGNSGCDPQRSIKGRQARLGERSDEADRDSHTAEGQDGVGRVISEVSANSHR
jgi:hypothetical protein